MITKEQFEDYLSCQKSGRFNMLDYNSWSPHTNLTKDEWFEIIRNYSELYDKYRKRQKMKYLINRIKCLLMGGHKWRILHFVDHVMVIYECKHCGKLKRRK